jgi:hypothetical protein
MVGRGVVIGLPSPYVIGAVAVLLLGSHTAVWLKATSAANGRWEAVRATDRADAMQVQLDAEKRAREAENRASVAAMKIGETHAKALQDLDATRADFSRRLHIATGSRCPNALRPPAADTGAAADTATRRDDESGKPDPRLSLRDAALELQAYAKSCNAWAMQIGR